MSFSQDLAGHVVRTSPEGLPPGALDRAVDAFVNWVGCAVGGAGHDTVEKAARAFRAIHPEGRHAVLGRDDRHGIVEAISIDCLTSAVLAFDDTHLETVLHPTGPVAAALLGLARERPVSGRDFAVALSLGMEVECRTALAFTTSGSGAKQGWYTTGITGGIGAAAGLGRAMGFDEGQVVNAMALAAARASGTRGTHGSMTAQYVPSMAAESGYISARMTEAGFVCGARALDGSSGLLDLLADAPAYDRALRDLGTVSEAAATAFKPYPSGIITHTVIDACLELLGTQGLRSADIASIAFDVSQTAMNLGSNRRPDDTFLAQVSLSYWAACTLLTGKASIAHMNIERIRDPSTRAFEERLTFTVDPALGLGQCRATATLANGQTVAVSVAHVTASPEKPMTASQVDEKFLSLVSTRWPESDARRLLDACRSLLDLDDVARVLAVRPSRG